MNDERKGDYAEDYALNSLVGKGVSGQFGSVRPVESLRVGWVRSGIDALEIWKGDEKAME